MLQTTQAAANNQHIGASLSWTAINNTINRVPGGVNIDFNSFPARYDADPILQSLVQSYDSNGVILKTDKDEIQSAMPVHKTGQVDKMARHAMKLGK